MVHRLLAVAIKADTSFPSMLNGENVKRISHNLNYRLVLHDFESFFYF